MPRLDIFTRTLVAAAIALASMAWAPDASAAVRVASWNVQILGPQKVKNPEAMKVIVDTVTQYDLVLVQELRDPTDNTATTLLNQVNAATGDAYRMLVSDRLGRANAKEQYIYLYRKSVLKPVDSYHYADTDDSFEREPFVVRFKTVKRRKASVKDFFVIPLHANPASAVEEVGSLVKVYDDAVKRWKIADGVIMGDMSAGCGYFAKKHWATNPLRQGSRFRWLIGDDINTTVGKATCAHDRAVVAGNKMRANTAQARTVYVDKKFNLSSDLMRQVSDHYPIQFVIK